MSLPKLFSISDVDLKDKKVLIRADFNCPIGTDGSILDDSRIKSHVTTVRECIERGASVVLISHQGRPGEDDFITLEKHGEVLAKYLGIDVKFVPDVIGPAALSEISKLKPSEVLLLDNLRLVSEEIIEAVPEVQAKTYLVRRLAPNFNYFVFDAFATAHRSQPSIVGFPMVLPSIIGNVMKKELDALSKVFSVSDGPRLFLLGGAKVQDTIKIIEFLTKNKVADRILTVGLVGLFFHVAKGGRIGDESLKVLESKGLLTLIPRARKLILSGSPIETPYDYVVLTRDGDVREESVYNLSGKALDIGSYTVSMYSELIKDAGLIVMRGPAGYVEDGRFQKGTIELLNAALRSNAFVIIGGGHLGAMVGNETRQNIHVSTGGGALLIYLSGEPLPAITALAESTKKFFITQTKLHCEG
ncbi:MAG: phosphoglycerate kinase [Sulfolobales archaeon]